LHRPLRHAAWKKQKWWAPSHTWPNHVHGRRWLQRRHWQRRRHVRRLGKLHVHAWSCTGHFKGHRPCCFKYGYHARQKQHSGIGHVSRPKPRDVHRRGAGCHGNGPGLALHQAGEGVGVPMQHVAQVISNGESPGGAWNHALPQPEAQEEAAHRTGASVLQAGGAPWQRRRRRRRRRRRYLLAPLPRRRYRRQLTVVNPGASTPSGAAPVTQVALKGWGLQCLYEAVGHHGSVSQAMLHSAHEGFC
jgi:hypothetical protein